MAITSNAHSALPWTLRALRLAIATAESLNPDFTARQLERLFFSPKRVARNAQELPLPTTEYVAGCAYVRRWEGDSRRIFILPGWEGHYTQFETLITRLLQSGYTAITVDPPAHGNAPGRKSHPGKFAEALRDAVQAEGEPFAFVGHSMGAGAGLLAAKTGTRLPRMVLIASPASFRYVVDGFLDFVGVRGRARTIFHQRLEGEVGHPLDVIDATHLTHFIRETPVLLIHDREDRRIPFAHAQRLLAGLQNAELHETQNLGHQRLLGNEDVVAHVLAFLERE